MLSVLMILYSMRLSLSGSAVRHIIRTAPYAHRRLARLGSPKSLVPTSGRAGPRFLQVWTRVS